MNLRENMIVIDGQIRTAQIMRCTINNRGDKYNIVFKNNPYKTYSYRSISCFTTESASSRYWLSRLTAITTIKPARLNLCETIKRTVYSKPMVSHYCVYPLLAAKSNNG